MTTMEIESIKKRAGEDDLEHLLRLYRWKKDGITPINYSDIFLEVFGKELSEDEARKRFYGVEMVIDMIPKQIKPVTLSTLPEEEKILLRDERNALRAEQRKNVRAERYLDVLKSTMTNLSSIKVPTDYEPAPIGDDKNSFVLQLSDWHLAMTVDSPWNKYDMDEFGNRIERYLKQAHEYINKFQPEEIIVLSQGDLLSGNIHSTLRLSNQEDLIKQIIVVAEKMCDIMSHLRSMTEAPISLYFVDGNHERVTANKKDNLASENYTRIIKWFCIERLKDLDVNVVGENEYGESIATFKLYDMNMAAVHGDKDSFNNALNNIVTMTRTYTDVIFTAHIHHSKFEDLQKCRVVANGSLVGMDEFAEVRRLYSYPSQNITIIKENKDIVLAPIIVGGKE